MYSVEAQNFILFCLWGAIIIVLLLFNKMKVYVKIRSTKLLILLIELKKTWIELKNKGGLTKYK